MGAHLVHESGFGWIGELERAPIDGLRQPEYRGGIAEVAKGLWIRREDRKRPARSTHLSSEDLDTCSNAPCTTGIVLELMGIYGREPNRVVGSPKTWYQTISPFVRY